MACNHLNELADYNLKKLIIKFYNYNMFIDAIQLEAGLWQEDIDTTRVDNHDEIPQFVNCEVDGTPNSLVYVPHHIQGKRCQCPHGPKRSS